MEYVVFETGGKQYKVSAGDTLEIERLAVPAGENFVFNRVLLHVSGEAVEIGTPFVSGFTVAAKVVSHTKGEKIDVSHFKAKARHRRTMGHRQALTSIQITGFGTEKKEKKTLKR